MSSPRGDHRPPDPAPADQPITLEDLPPPDTKRWVSRRKAQVVAAVRQGLLTLEDACRRYNLSMEEFLSWQRLVDRHGVPGLRATRLQDYRAPSADDLGDGDPGDDPSRDGGPIPQNTGSYLQGWSVTHNADNGTNYIVEYRRQR